MPVINDFPLFLGNDQIVPVTIAPPTPIGGYDLLFRVTRNYGSTSGFITKSAASGYNGVSGITIISSGGGQLQVRINAVDSSGLGQGAYFYALTRINSGFVTELAEGFMLAQP